jgi:hypothetical protein
MREAKFSLFFCHFYLILFNKLILRVYNYNIEIKYKGYEDTQKIGE